MRSLSLFNSISQAVLNPVTSMDMTTEFFDVNTSVSLFCLSLIVWFLFSFIFFYISCILIAFDSHRRSCGAKALWGLMLESQRILTSIFDCLYPSPYPSSSRPHPLLCFIISFLMLQSENLVFRPIVISPCQVLQWNPTNRWIGVRNIMLFSTTSVVPTALNQTIIIGIHERKRW